jgi:hypothetical protein
LNILKIEKKAEDKKLNDFLKNLFIKNCLNRRTKSFITLTNDREFESQYDKFKNEAKNDSKSQTKALKFILFHKIYSIYLLCNNEVDKMIKLNENFIILDNKNNVSMFDSDIYEFYLRLLNYLYFTINKIERFYYKVNLFNVIKLISGSIVMKMSKPLMRIVSLSLIKLKVNNLIQSNSFDTQTFENNDIDLTFNSIANNLTFDDSTSSNASLFLFALLFTECVSIELKINKTNGLSNNNSLFYKLRRQFNQIITNDNFKLINKLSKFYFDVENKIDTLIVNDIKSNEKIKLKKERIFYESIKREPFKKVNLSYFVFFF